MILSPRVLAVALCLLPVDVTDMEAEQSGLRIVVLAGEDGVNVVQQKTALAPVVEVRDRNDQPVAGAVVRFAVRKGRGTFGGAPSLVVATNALGRAEATGLVPTGKGALQITATATFQGQTATVTIAQMNVMTAAEVAAVAGGIAAGGATGGGGGLLGGGIATTAAIVGGGAVGGLYAYKQTQQGDPPVIESLAVSPNVMLVGNFFAVLVSATLHADDNESGTVTWDFGDGVTLTSAFGGQQPVHTYTSTGTFTLRVTLTDPKGRSASAEETVKVVSLSGQWTSSAGTGTYSLTQSGTTVTGTFTAPSGASASISGSISAGGVIMTWPTLAGTSIFTPTFAGGLLNADPNRLSGSLSGSGFSNTGVTITRQ